MEKEVGKWRRKLNKKENYTDIKKLAKQKIR